MKLFKQSDKLDYEQINEVVGLSKRILHILYIAMIVAMVLIVTIIVREWGILKFILSILSVLAPFFIGFVLAWLMNPLVTKMEKKKIPRPAGTIIVYTIFLAIVILFIRFLIPIIYEQLQVFIANLPAIFRELENFLNDLFAKFGDVQGLDLDGIKTTILNSLLENNFSIQISFHYYLINLIISLYVIKIINAISKKKPIE